MTPAKAAARLEWAAEATVMARRPSSLEVAVAGMAVVGMVAEVEAMAAEEATATAKAVGGVGWAADVAAALAVVSTA